MSAATERTAIRDWPTIGALGVLTVVLTVVAGPVGTVAAIATALTWYVLEPPYALAVGHVALVPAFPDGIGPSTFVLVECAFVAVLLGATVEPTTALGDAIAVLASAAGLVGVAWVIGRSGPLWAAAVALLALFALAAYTLHRYELVRFGLVPDDHAADSQPLEP